MKILISLMAGGFIGLFTMALLSANQYEKVMRDVKKERDGDDK